jgi:hypothetical protein
MAVQSKYVYYSILFRNSKAGREDRLTLDRTEKDREIQGRTEQTGQDRTRQDRTGGLGWKR